MRPSRPASGPFLLASLLLASSARADLHLASRTVPVPAVPAPALLASALPGDGLYLLATSDPAGASLRNDLEEAGIGVIAYVPDGGLLVKASPAGFALLRARPSTRALLPLEAADKLSPRIGSSAWEDEPDLARLLTVQCLPGTDLEPLASFATAVTGGDPAGASPRSSRPRFTLRVPPGREREAALALAALPEVLWIEPASRLRFLNDTSIWVGQSWDTVGLATPVFAHGLHGEGQIVGVSDTGLDADHASFYDPSQGLPTATPNLLQRKVIAYHDRRQDSNWDNNNHGTHVAGTVAGDLNGNGTWDANGPNQAPDGMAPAAKLAISDADDTDLPGNPIDLTELFAETYQDGARLHTNSWVSCSCNEYTVHSQDVDEFLWMARDMTILFAAGNSGPGAGTVRSPGTAKDAITVGATQRAAAADSLAGFSSRGPTDDGRRKPTVTAPGVNIRSALGDRNVTTFNDGVAAFSGTSMATPTATGLTTLVREYLVKGHYPSGLPNPADAIGAPSAALLKALIVNSGRSMRNETPAPSQTQGWGRILLDDVLYFPGDARRLWLHDDARGPGAPGEERSFPLLVGASGQDLEVTLAWTDPPAALLVGPKLVNDLDLVVSGPPGTFLGNVYAGESSTLGGSPDRLNVEEGVRIPAAPPGLYQVRVKAASVPFGPQPFALVATGDVRPAPHLGYAAHLLTDPEGNRNGVAEPGELVELALTLAETGGTQATGIRVRVEPLVPWARVVFADTLPFPDAPALGRTDSLGTWVLSLAAGAPCGELLPLALHIESAQGAHEDQLDLPTGGDQRSTTVVLEDGFDSVAAGAPPDASRWTTGFVSPPAGGVTLRVEADASVEPPPTAPASPPNALYIGRRSGNNASSESYLQTLPLDLGGHDAARLSFRYWVRSLEGGIAARDRFQVLGSTDGGATFPLLLYTNPDYASGMDSSLYPDRRWHEVRIDLGRAGLLTSPVTLRFAVLVNSDEPGDAVYLDDVRIEGDRVRCDPGCIPPRLLASSFGPACAGGASRLTGSVLAEGFGAFDLAWDLGDGSRTSVTGAGELVTHAYPQSGAYFAVLTASSPASPGCGSSAGVTVDVDEPPGWLPSSNAPVCRLDPRVSLGASLIRIGHGPARFEWDFGDASPLVAVPDPGQPLEHLYPGVVAIYSARLAATSTRVPGCRTESFVPVEVIDSVAPAGSVGNRLVAVRRAAEVFLDWSEGPLLPPLYNVHRTARKQRLVETRAVLGAEPVIAEPRGVESALDGPPAQQAVWLYKVVGRDPCGGGSVLP